MNVFLNILGIVMVFFVLSLASIGAATVTGLIDRLKVVGRRNQADQQIADIGRAAQMAILQEALRRATGDRSRAGE